MASEGPNYATDATNDAGIGTTPWELDLMAGVYATTPADVGSDEASVKLVVGGTVTGTDHSTGATLPSVGAETVTYGNATDKWGLTLSSA